MSPSNPKECGTDTNRPMVDHQAVADVHRQLDRLPGAQRGAVQFLVALLAEHVQWGNLIPTLRGQAEEGAKFKAYVHKWLDDQGVPHDPDPEENKRTGCRLGCRFRWLINRHQQEVGHARQLHYTQVGEIRERLKFHGVDPGLNGIPDAIDALAVKRTVPSTGSLEELCMIRSRRVDELNEILAASNRDVKRLQEDKERLTKENQTLRESSAKYIDDNNRLTLQRDVAQKEAEELRERVRRFASGF